MDKDKSIEDKERELTLRLQKLQQMEKEIKEKENPSNRMKRPRNKSF